MYAAPPPVRLRGPGTLLLALAALGATASRTAAQSVGVRFVLADVRHDLLGTMHGAGALASLPLSDRLSLRLGVDRLRGDRTRIGVACGGLAPPTCLTEPLHDDAYATTFSAGVGATVLRTGGFAWSITGDGGISSVRSATLGENSGNRLSASRRLWRGDLGTEGAWRPAASSPFSLSVGGSVGFQAPFQSEVVADGYTPFERRHRVSRLWLGAAWAVSRARP